VYEATTRGLGKSAASFATIEGTESVIAQGARSISLEPGKFVVSQQKGKAQYGWPLLIFQAADRSKVIAPLFTVACDTAFDSELGRQVVTVVTDPDINVALFSPQLLSPDLQVAFEEAIGEDPDFSSPESMKSLFEEISTLLELPLGDLNGPLQTKIPTSVGIHHVATLTPIEESDITRDLLNELDLLATRTDWLDTAAAMLLGVASTPPSNGSQSKHKTHLPVAPLSVNESQEEALEQIREGSLTVVTGPPGTGKSQIVVSAVANAWLNGESVLLASTNNAAVDVAVERANMVAPGLLVRTGNKAARDELPTAITNLRQLYSKRPDRADVLAASGRLSRSFEARSKYLDSLKQLQSAERRLLDLVVETHESARYVWADPEVQQANFANFDLAHEARRILQFPLFRRFRMRSLFSRANCPGNHADLESISNLLHKCRQLKKAQTLVRASRNSVIPNLNSDLAALDAEYVAASLNLIRLRVHDSIAFNQTSITSVTAAGLGGRKQLDATRYARKALRGWACTALSMRRNFELAPGIFDLAIIDEASQCSLAYILPIAYRSKRMTVVGDPNQLPPVITLGPRKARSLARKNGVDKLLQRNSGIDFVDGSAFHAFEGVLGHEKTLLLNEHFRCHPKIARWFNYVFYGDSLHVLTDVSKMHSNERGMIWVDTHGSAQRPASGRSWINYAEADVAVELVVELASQGLTVGVVSPFAAQATLIQSRLESLLDPSVVADLNLIVGTAHRLQGDERDVIIFSCCVTPGTLQSTIKWIEIQRNLVNVAVSRARQCLYILGHPSIEAMSSPTLTSLRAFALTSQEDPLIQHRIDSHAERVLLEAMVSIGLAPLSKIESDGFELDFAIITQTRQFDIEVDGDHHIDEQGCLRRRDVARDRVLEAAGWTVLRFPAWRCWSEPLAVAKEISDMTRSDVTE
jgi:RecA/RadA recombinase